MGSNNSLINEEQIEEYVQLTYLNKMELKIIIKKFAEIDCKRFACDKKCCFTSEEISSVLPELKTNPFADRVFKVFSTAKNGTLSLDDFVNLCSVFSDNCPLEVKANWAFLIFDFDEDHQMMKNDIFELIDRLTGPNKLLDIEKADISDVLLAEMDLKHLGGISQVEFLHAIRKLPDFTRVFSFKP